MGIFDKIKGAIWGQAQAATPSTETAQADTATVTQPAATQASGATAGAVAVDVSAILDAAVQKSGQKLNWKTSIVDLLKALGLDSSLEHRKELAKELGYTGDASDSATLNIWLHKQVIQKLKDNGGVLPAEL